MAKFEIFLGAVGIVVALFCVGYVLFEKKSTTIALGAAALLGACGGYLLSYGIHGYHAGFYAKHQAIYRDALRQGFKVKSWAVYARDGVYYYGTEVDLLAGGCWWPFHATKLDGTWRLTLDGPKTIQVIRPAAVADLAAACSR
jgi:hypothetical protein